MTPGSGIGDEPSPAAARFHLQLQVAGAPTALTLVRHAVGGAATAIGLDPAAVADIRLALTEVCSAAVRRGDGGPIDVTAEARDGTLRVVVRDRSPAPAGGPGEMLPLPLVAAITETLELRRARGGGTEVTMTFALAGD